MHEQLKVSTKVAVSSSKKQKIGLVFFRSHLTFLRVVCCGFSGLFDLEVAYLGLCSVIGASLKPVVGVVVVTDWCRYICMALTF